MPWRLNRFDDFIILRNIELIVYISWLCSSHCICTLTFIVYSCLFSWAWYMLYGPWVFSDHVIYMYFMKYNFVFIPYLKDFVLVYKFFHITSCGILRYGRSFQAYYIFQTYFWKPLPSKGGWMGDHAHVCFIVKIILNLSMKWVVGYMRYTLDIIVVSIWYHWIFSIGINIDIFVYSYIFFVCMLRLQIVSISIGI